MKKTNRRQFIQSGSALAGFFILPSGLRASSPNSRLCTAHVGVAGKGATDTLQIAAHPRTQVVALCDVDRDHLAGMGRRNKKSRGALPKAEKFPRAYRFTLTRRMVDVTLDLQETLVAAQSGRGWGW